MSVPGCRSSPGIGDAGGDVAANTRRLVVLPSGRVDVPKSQNVRARLTNGRRLLASEVAPRPNLPRTEHGRVLARLAPWTLQQGEVGRGL
jgi:hypothetical protein